MYKIIITLLFLIASCTHSMIGKTLPTRNYPQFTHGEYGHHVVKFERGIADLDYYWTIKKENMTLTLEGTYNIYDANWKAVKNAPWQGSGLTIEAYLLNDKYEIVHVEQVGGR